MLVRKVLTRNCRILWFYFYFCVWLQKILVLIPPGLLVGNYSQFWKPRGGFANIRSTKIFAWFSSRRLACPMYPVTLNLLFYWLLLDTFWRNVEDVIVGYPNKPDAKQQYLSSFSLLYFLLFNEEAYWGSSSLKMSTEPLVHISFGCNSKRTWKGTWHCGTAKEA